MHKSDCVQFLVYLCLILSPIHFAKASNLYVDEQAFLFDIPTVTSATRLTQHLRDAPVSMTVIDRNSIQASGAQTIPDLLRLVPGFQVAHVNTNKYAVTYHGHSDDFPKRLEVMVDGRSVYMPLISSPDWTSLGVHLDDIEKIEVIRGSNTATHGSNAFLGAINIITRHPASVPRASGSLSLGSLNTTNSQLRFSGMTPQGHYRLSYGHEQNSGSRQFSDGARRNYLNFSGSYAPTDDDQIEIRLGIDRGYTTIGSLKTPNSVDNIVTKERDYRSNFQHIVWNHALTNQLSIELSGYRNALRLAEQTTSLGDLLRLNSLDLYQLWKSNPTIFNQCSQQPILDPVICQVINLQANSLSSTPNFRLHDENGSTRQEDIQLSTILNQENLSSVIGMGYRRDIGKGRTLFDAGDVRSNRYRLFLSTVYSPSPFYTLNLGVLHEVEESRSKANSFRTALNLHPNNDLTFRLGYSHSERLPSLYESYGQITYYLDGDRNRIFNAVKRPNLNLASERVTSQEVGVLYNFQTIKGNIDLRIFNERISRGIETIRVNSTLPQMDNSETVRIEKNISRWSNLGAEFQLKMQPTNQLWFLFNYAYINSTKDGFNNGNRWIERSQLAPRHSASALVNWQVVPDLHLSATHYYQDVMHWFKGDTRKAYNRTDLRIAKQWYTDNNITAETSFTVQNALGKTYQEFYDYHDFERRFFLTFRLKYE